MSIPTPARLFWSGYLAFHSVSDSAGFFGEDAVSLVRFADDLARTPGGKVGPVISLVAR
jgi:hypothetical protein